MRIYLALFVFYFSVLTGAHGACLDISASENSLKISPPKEMIVSTQERLYFYSVPNDECKINGLFVVNKDHLLAYHKNKNFTYVNYLTKENKIISGWVHSSGIAAVLNSQDSMPNILDINDFVIYKNKSAILIGSSVTQFNNWARKIRLKLSDPILAGIDENNWMVSFNGGYAGLNEVDKLIEGRIGNDGETYLAVINISDKGFETNRGISIGSGWNDVLDKYGKDNGISDGQSCIYYQYFWMKLTFCEKNNSVNMIEMSDVSSN